MLNLPKIVSEHNMLKRFFISFLGSLAGILVAGIIGIIFLVAVIAMGAASSGSSAEKKTTVKAGSILKIELSGELVERRTPANLMDMVYGEPVAGFSLENAIAALKQAANDDKIAGVYLDCKGASGGLALFQELEQALTEFKKSGKWIYAYGDNYSQGDYYLATTADSVFVNPVGMIDIHGLSGTILYYKDLLDKLGVKVQVVRVGTYKSAVEPFILSDMSEASREQTEAYLNNMWGNFASTIAGNRGVDLSAVNRWADNFAFASDVKTYIKNKVADKALYEHQVKDILAKLTDKEKPNFVDFGDYISANPVTKKKGANIAVLYAIGDITEDGKDGIASSKLVPQILKLAKDKKIDALVMRVNSPGGSAFASEQIWEALRQFKKISGKPFYVSMGTYAASGGYYISCGADRIFAEPLTITGSIGIFGMVPDVHGLLHDKIGINTATIATNKGSFPNFYNAMTPELAAAMQNYVNRGYELFTSRCAAGRHVSVDSIKAIAEGRVWDGATALKIGLIDQLGSLQDAIAAVAAKVNESSGESEYYVTTYPKVKMEWWEELIAMKDMYSERVLAEKLGDVSHYYFAVKNFKEMSPLQCRMDYIEVH